MADNHSVSRYRATSDFILFDSLIGEREELIIQSYDSVSGRKQKVFNSKRELLGEISSSTFWNLNGKYIERSHNEPLN